MRSSIGRALLQLVLGLSCAISAGQDTTAGEFTQDFRGRPYDTRYFRLTGNTNRAIRAEFRGFRICLVDAERRLPVGLVSRLGIRGDFEMTMTFEILRLQKPTGGNGAGVSIYVSTASLTQEAATLGRFLRPNGEQVFLCHRAFTLPGEERQHEGKHSRTTALSGRLRLVRTGTVLSYQAAESGRSAFEELYHTEWAGEDLDTVRFAAENGGSPTIVDVLIKGVTIRADEFGPARPVPQPFRWTPGMTWSLILIFLTTGSLWLWLRWRRTYLDR